MPTSFQKKKYQYDRNFCTICQKKMYNTTFPIAIGMLNLFIHKSKMAATAIL